jgi:hypothetical protein
MAACLKKTTKEQVDSTSKRSVFVIMETSTNSQHKFVNHKSAPSWKRMLQP